MEPRGIEPLTSAMPLCALSQLSYGPLCRVSVAAKSKSSAQLILRLWLFWRGASRRLDRRRLLDERNRDEEAAIELHAVGGDRIDLFAV